MAGNQGKHSAENGKKGGRPKATATLIAQEFKKALSEQIKSEMQEWIDPMKDLAKGHFIQVKTKDGEVKVYKKSPDAQAWEKVMNRAFGKPKETIEHVGDEENPVRILRVKPLGEDE